MALAGAAPDGGGVLLILPPEPDGRGIPPSLLVAGLPLLRRIVLAANRAGFGAVLVGGLRSEDQPLLAGTSATPIGGAGALPSPLPPRIVLLAANVVPQPAWLRGLRERALEPDQLCVDDASVAVIETTESARVVEAAARARSAGEAMAALRGMFKTASESLGTDGHFPLSAPGDLTAAESWLLRSLITPSEGFMSRHFERRLSLALTRRLVRTAITPNLMTLVSVAVGLASAPFFLSSAPGWQLAGALLFLAHSILDGCDGELARLKFLESPHGAILDFWGDNLVHVVVFAGMALGWSLDARASWPLLFGAVAVASTAGAAVAVYRRGAHPPVPVASASPSSRVVEALAHRDFIYLIVLLAAAGKAAWFLVLAAMGTPIFLLLVLWSGRRRSELDRR